MATKRGADPDLDDPGHQPNTKRTRNKDQQQGPSKRKQLEPATNATYGQRCCFPGVDSNGAGYHSDEDLEFEDESDAMAYLQSVRQEASMIPHLLVATKSGPQPPLPSRRPPRTTTRTITQKDLDDDDEPIDRSIYTEVYSDARGYYQDGAYTAAPDPQTSTTHTSEDGDEALEVAEAYFASLCYQFSRLRTQLHTPPPSHLVLPKTHAPYVGPFGPSSRTFTVWTSRLLTTDPHPIQIALMDKNSAFRLLRVLLGGGKFLRSGVEVTERTSRWVWSLLARLPDRGELDHIETGHIRELGKRAAVLMHSLKQMALLKEEVELGGHGDEDAIGVWGGDDAEEDEEQVQGKDAETEVKPKEEDDNPRAETTTSMIRHDNDEHSADTSTARPKPVDADTKTRARLNVEQDEMEEGEIDDFSDQSVSMDMDDEEDMEAAKVRLLASLDAVPSSPSPSSASLHSKQKDFEQEDEKFDPVRARMNMRATLNMVLTVAGEFYGQRDLLEFRDPFRGL